MRLKFAKKYMKLIKITNCVCSHICNGCDVAVVRAECVHTQRAPQQHHIRPHTQFVILINFMYFLTNFNLIICTFQYVLARTNELPENDTSCVETCRSSLFVISTIIVTDIYVHSLVELEIIKKMHGTSIKIKKGYYRNMSVDSICTKQDRRTDICVL